MHRACCCLGVFACCTGRAAPPALVLRPARVFDGVAAEPHEGWAVLVRGEKIEAVGAGGRGEGPRGGQGDRAAGGDAAAGADRCAYARAAAPVQRGRLERPGAQGSPGAAGLPGHEPPEEQPALGVHHDPRPGDRGGRLRGRRAEAGGRAGHHPGPADARDHARHRGHRLLRPQGVRPRMAHPPGRRGGRRP